jgi:hypothetical protein
VLQAFHDRGIEGVPAGADEHQPGNPVRPGHGVGRSDPAAERLTHQRGLGQREGIEERVQVAAIAVDLI